MNNIEIILTDEAIETLEILKNDKSKVRILKDVVKALNLMGKNLRHPSLNTHEFTSLKGPSGEKVFEAYASKKLLELIEFSGIMVLVEMLFLSFL